jgi:hypothetical protein
MQLIDRYIYAVTRSLPYDQRADVAKELEATIEDMVTDSADGKKPTKKQIESVLLELGDPVIFASRYRHGQKYLIGPMWFAIYKFWLMRLMAFVPLGFALLAFLGGLSHDTSVWQRVLEAVGAAFTGAIQVGFWTTLVFAILEWTQTAPEATAALPEEWSPSHLPELPYPNQISHADAAAGMFFTVIFTGVLALLSVVSATWIGASVPVLNPALAQGWILVFIALGVVAFIQEAVKYRVGKWTTGLAIFNTLLSLANIVYFVSLVVTQKVVNPAFLEWLNQQSNTNVDFLGSFPVWITVVIIVISFGWSALQSIVDSRKKSDR